MTLGLSLEQKQEVVAELERSARARG